MAALEAGLEFAPTMFAIIGRSYPSFRLYANKCRGLSPAARRSSGPRAGVERRPSLDGLWRRGDPGVARRPTFPWIASPRVPKPGGRNDEPVRPNRVALKRAKVSALALSSTLFLTGRPIDVGTKREDPREKSP
jgi:hypothetical protein